MTEPNNAISPGQEQRDADRFERLRDKAARHGIELRRSPLVGFVIVTPVGLLAHGHLSTLAQHLGGVLEQRKRGRQPRQEREIRPDQGHPLTSPLKGLTMQPKTPHALDVFEKMKMPGITKVVQKGAYRDRRAVDGDPQAHAARQGAPVNADPRRTGVPTTAASTTSHNSRTAVAPKVEPSSLSPAENVRPAREAATAVPFAGGAVNEDLFANNVRAQRAREQYVKDQINDAIRRK
jgi:hypothetical protein